jgi:hypothetical protein
MPERSRKKKPRDVNTLVAAIVSEATGDEVSEATGDEPDEEKPEKNAAAVELGRSGGLKGGKARAAKMTKEERSEAARKAARARWSSDDATDRQ